MYYVGFLKQGYLKSSKSLAHLVLKPMVDVPHQNVGDASCRWLDTSVVSIIILYIYGGFLKWGSPKSPWVSILNGPMTLMIWGTPIA